MFVGSGEDIKWFLEPGTGNIKPEYYFSFFILPLANYTIPCFWKAACHIDLYVLKQELRLCRFSLLCNQEN